MKGEIEKEVEEMRVQIQKSCRENTKLIREMKEQLG